MREQSTFSNNEIKQICAEKYDISINNIEVINKGNASIYKLTANDKKKYILKEFQSKYKENDIERECKAVEYLRENTDIPVVKYIKTNNKKDYFTHNGRVAILQEFVNGYEYEKNECDYNRLIQSATCLGKIIKGFKNYNVDKSFEATKWFSDEEFEKANNKFNIILDLLEDNEIENKIKKDILFKKKLLKEIKDIIDLKDIELVTHSISHGDYSCLQLMYNDKDEVVAVLDFIKVKRLPIVWEIARSYSYADIKAKNGNIDIDNLIDYVKEVSKYIELNTYDYKYLSYVYLVQLARSPFGYEEYFKDDVENKQELLDFAFYRTKICKNLYEKAEKISKILLSNAKIDK